MKNLEYLDLTVEQLVTLIERCAEIVPYEQAEEQMIKLDEVIQFVKKIQKTCMFQNNFLY